MKNILLKQGESKIGYDLFTWSDNRKAAAPNCWVSILISNDILSELSSLIWNNSIEMLSIEPRYFIDFEEPNPSHENTILNNPYLLNEYFQKSHLWADFIVDKLSILQKWDFKNYNYHLLKFKEVIEEKGQFYLRFYAIEIAYC